MIKEFIPIDKHFSFDRHLAVRGEMHGFGISGSFDQSRTIIEPVTHHMKFIGLIKTEEMSDHQKKYLDEKRKEFEDKHGESSANDENSFPDKATLCSKCSTKAMVLMDGCMTCLNCGESKCG